MNEKSSFHNPRRFDISNLSNEKKKFPEIVDEIIDESNIILEILDARFIDETRNLVFEEKIKQKGKKIIYILNKIDLMKKHEIIQSMNKIRKLNPIPISAKNKTGVKELRERIKIEVKKLKINEKIFVGVIGYPNTGKSSLINLLSGTGKTEVSKESGFTKGKKKVYLTRNIILIDSPGVFPDKEKRETKVEYLSRHIELCSKGYDNVDNPEDVLDYLMKKYPGKFERFYNVKVNDSEELVEIIGKRKNFLKKGGEVNGDRTARFILRELQEGKIISMKKEIVKNR